MKEFKIVFAEGASTDEITDTVADVFGVAFKLEDALSDGFQLEDVLVAIQLESAVREVINDFPVFIDQFRKLSGSVALEAVLAAKARTEAEFGELGRIGGFAYNLLTQIADTFGFIEQTIVSGIQQRDQWSALFDSLKPAE